MLRGGMENLRFGWWNTSLSPAGKSRGNDSPARWEVACEVVRCLIDEEGLGLLALGEVAADDVERLYDVCGTTALGMIAPPLDTDNERFPKGIAILYDEEVLDRVAYETLSTTYLGNAILRCLHATFQLREHSQPELHAFALHWPSAMDPAAQAKRSRLAQDLRARILELPPFSHTVILGDFNVEPFDPVLCNDLEASRDRDRVRTKRLLYNPLWRHLGEQQALQGETQGQKKGAGTYFYRSDQSTSRWYNYDQVLVSASLLEMDGWQLWEEDVGIWQEPPLIEPRTGRPHTKFDHFPIVGSLRRPPR